MVFKLTADQKLIPNLQLKFWINMRWGEKLFKPSTNYEWVKWQSYIIEKTGYEFHVPILSSSSWPFRSCVSVPTSTPASLFSPAAFCRPAIVRVDIPFCFWLHDLRGSMNHNWKLSMPIPGSNIKTKHFISISNTFLIHYWATKCTSFNQLAIN